MQLAKKNTMIRYIQYYRILCQIATDKFALTYEPQNLLYIHIHRV